MTVAKVLNTKLIRATLAEFVGLTSYQSNDAVHQGSWYGNSEVRHLMKWEDWKPDEDLNQMAMVEAKIMTTHSMAVGYGAALQGAARFSDSQQSPNRPFLAVAFAATIKAPQRAHAACQVIQEKWQEQ